MTTDKHRLLKEVFGHPDFRPGQEQAIDALLSGRDILAVMPTGAGKSVCYQLPALMLDGITLVISPLISLMQDQSLALAQNGVSAAFINSTLSSEDFFLTLKMAEQGECKLLFVAPERLETESFRRFALNNPISMVTVDEAHCVSQWGQDFRPSYLKIADFIASLPTRPVVGAFTATATDEVRHDIKEKLCLNEPEVIVTGFDRPNLFFEVMQVEKRNKPDILAELLHRFEGRSGIIYCSTRKQTEEVLTLCRANGAEAAMYHAGMSDKARYDSQQDFIYDRVRVMAATNAFGMGIDKSNVGFVIHYSMPKSPEAYYQEAGRAGRDGTAADCVLLYSPSDLNTALYFIEHTEGEGLTPEELDLFKKQERRRLDAMVEYCTRTGCLREYLLDYFGEKCEQCSGCSNCMGEFTDADITDAAQRIISCIFRLSQRRLRFGINMICAILKGGRDRRILEMNLNTLSTYGIMSNYKRKELKAVIDSLTRDGYLARSDDEYRLLSITEKGHNAVIGREKITMRVRADKHSEKPSAPQKQAAAADYDSELFERLRSVRSELARNIGVPAYIVFSNAALEDMARRKPLTEQEFLQVNGVGDMKLEMYGKQFIGAITEFVQEKTKAREREVRQ